MGDLTAQKTETAGDNRRELDDRDRQPLVRWEELFTTALGAALAALLLSRLGVAGTIAGAACTPVIITITSAVISRQIVVARKRAAALSATRRASWWRRLGERLPRGRRLAAALVTAGTAFAIVLATITIAEAIAGKPVSDWGHSGGSGYTFTGGHARSPSPPSRSTPTTPTHPSGVTQTQSSTATQTQSSTATQTQSSSSTTHTQTSGPASRGGATRTSTGPSGGAPLTTSTTPTAQPPSTTKPGAP